MVVGTTRFRGPLNQEGARKRRCCDSRDLSPPRSERDCVLRGHTAVRTRISAKIRRIAAESWPFIVADRSGDIAGYAYAMQFRDREAYRYAAEDSIYVAPSLMRRGVGRALLSTLLECSRSCGFRTMVAVIGGAEPASIALHSSLGFVEVGRLKSVGYKFGRWLDNVYMQRDLDVRIDQRMHYPE